MAAVHYLGSVTKKSKKGMPGAFSSILLCMGVAVWVWSAVYPLDFNTWMIEQVATVVAGGCLVWLAPRVDFDRTSLIALLLLFCAHTIGTHYTYSLTPYEQLSRDLLGSAPSQWFDWQRNHYDRFVHFAYGFLITHPTEQALRQMLLLPTRTTMFFSLQLVLSTSALYELVEWLAAVFIGGDLGAAYLGAQGDIWDAQADMALAGAGWLCFQALCWMYRALRAST